MLGLPTRVRTRTTDTVASCAARHYASNGFPSSRATISRLAPYHGLGQARSRKPHPPRRGGSNKPTDGLREVGTELRERGTRAHSLALLARCQRSH